MSLNDIVSVVITTQAKGISQRGFGTPLVAGYHTNFLDRVREYDDPADLVSDGFSVYDPIYRAAQRIMGQTPHPTSFKVGTRLLPFTQVKTLKVTATTEGLVYTVRVVSPDGTETVCSYTVLSGDSANDIAVALAALITAIADITAPAPVGDTITATADNPGEMFYFEELNKELEITDTTADPGIATDLSAILSADPDWYGLVIDSNSEAEIKAAQAWLETQERIAGFQSKDAGIKDSGVSDDVASDMQSAAYARCLLHYSSHDRGYLGAGLMGLLFTTNPGSATWAYKSVAGVEVDTDQKLTATEKSTIESKDCNYYNRIANANVTLWGKSPAGEYLDIIRGRDWLAARIRERVFSLLVNNPKLPYTDASVDLVRGQIRAQLREGIANGYIAADPEFIVTAPLVADVSPTDRANRILPDVRFEATLAGAIHEVRIQGVLSI